MLLPEPAISDELRRSVVALGDAGEEWLDNLPSLVARVVDDWQLRLDAPLVHGGHASVVYAVTTKDGQNGILKLSLPHHEARWEAASLRRWDGHGAVRLLRASDDGHVLLLERCRPGEDLWTTGIHEQRQVAATLLPRLWVEVETSHPFPSLAETAARWESEMHARARVAGLGADLVGRARAWSVELRESQPLVLLHGDFHPANVLRAEREPWLVIDPKSWVGDPAFDLAQWLYNRIARCSRHEDRAAAARDEARALADLLDQDPQRILRWAVVKAIGWNFGRDETLVLDAAAASGTPLDG